MRSLLGHKFLLLLVVAYTLIITWLSTAKIFIPIKVDIRDSDKIGHFMAYTVFTVVWFSFFFYSEKLKRPFTKSLVLAAVIGFFYGVLMEMCQGMLTNYRSPDYKDILANTAGIIFAAVFLKICRNQLIRIRRNLFEHR